MKVIVFFDSGIGNSIIATPLVREIYKQTRAKIYAVNTLKGISRVFENNSYVFKNLEFDFENSSLFKKILFALRLRVLRPDFLISPYPSRLRHRFAKLVGGKYLIARSDNKTRDVKVNLALLREMGLKNSKVYTPDFFNTDKEIDFAEKKLSSLKGKIAGFHLGSKGDAVFKRFPDELFVSVGKELIKRGFIVLLFEGPDELGSTRIVKQKLGKKAIVLRSLSLGKTGALIGLCDIFVSNDSGLMHLASAKRVPTIGLFSYTNFNRTAPINGLVVRRDLKCMPCYEISKPPKCSEMPCKDISPKEIMKAVNKLLN